MGNHSYTTFDSASDWCSEAGYSVNETVQDTSVSIIWLLHLMSRVERQFLHGKFLNVAHMTIIYCYFCLFFLSVFFLQSLFCGMLLFFCIKGSEKSLVGLKNETNPAFHLHIVCSTCRLLFYNTTVQAWMKKVMKTFNCHESCCRISQWMQMRFSRRNLGVWGRRVFFDWDTVSMLHASFEVKSTALELSKFLKYLTQSINFRTSLQKATRSIVLIFWKDMATNWCFT